MRDLLLQAGALSGLKPDDIKVVPSGVTGEDLWLSPKARQVYGFAFEVKCQERLNIWEAYDQAEGHATGTDYIPVVVFRRNHGRLKICMDFERFLKLIREERAVHPPDPILKDQEQLPHLGG